MARGSCLSPCCSITLNAIACCCSSCSLKVMQQIKQMQEAMQVSGVPCAQRLFLDFRVPSGA